MSRASRLAAPLFAALALAALRAQPQSLAQGAQAAGFDQIVSAVTSDNHDASCAAMQRWVDAHARDERAAQGLLWMARLRISDRKLPEARALYERVLREHPQGEFLLHAKKGLADLDLEAWRFAPAIATYDALAREPSPLWQYVGSNAAENARGERLRFYLMVALCLALAALWLVRVARLGPRKLWPLPQELVYLLPILLVLLVASTAQEEPEAHTLVAVSLGATALLWLNGAWLRARAPGLRTRLAEAALGVAQALALLFCAMVANGLWGKLKDTIAMGAE